MDAALHCHIAVPPGYPAGRRGVAVVAYDLDHTLIKPKGGRKRARDHDDWELLSPAVKRVVQAERDAGVLHVIVSNQSGCKTAEQLESFADRKVRKVIRELGVPCAVIVAGGYGPARKPKTAGWRRFLEVAGIADIAALTYVGDAAGRPGDFADTDLTFARNIGAQFRTPEEHFDGGVVEHPEPKFDPCEHLHHAPNPESPAAFFGRGRKPEVVLMCGPPGSGKSAFVRRHKPEGYAVVEQDNLKTKAKCLKAIRAALLLGQSVLIDKTFLRASDRQLYANEALEAGAKQVRVVRMTTPLPLANHLNAMRSEHPTHAKPRVGPSAIRMMMGQYTPPAAGAESIAEVYDAPFCFDEAETDPALFTQWHC